MAADQQSFLAWGLRSLGPVWGSLILGAGLVVFLGACAVVLFQRRRSVIAAYLVFVPLPWLLGILGTFWGAMQSFAVIAQSPVAPKPGEIAAGVSTSLFSSMVGLGISFPAYLVIAVGLFLRAVWHRDETASL